MKVTTIRPRGFEIDITFDAEDLKKLHVFLNRCSIEYDSEKEPAVSCAVDYVTKDFYIKLDRLVSEIEDAEEIANES